jgi:hypothetical protein
MKVINKRLLMTCSAAFIVAPYSEFDGWGFFKD